MSHWVRLCCGAYRVLARAFPHDFRATCGDGLEQLGQDVIPLLWRDHGVIGIARVFGDLLRRLPTEYIAAMQSNVKELIMIGDVLEGTWRAKIDESNFDPKYTPQQACLRLEATETGYLVVAYGIKDGQAVAERPTAIIADGRRRPLVDLNGRPIAGVPAGAMTFGHQPDPRTLEAGAEADGKLLGKGIYQVSEDGKTMTVTTEGMGLKGPFKTTAVFERVVPDPYMPQV